MNEHQYYFRKPKSEIAKDIFKLILISGTICVAATSPYFVWNLWKAHKRFKKYKKEKVYDIFYNLRKQGYIEIEKENKQIYIKLTKKGNQKAGWFQINDLKINKPKKWNKKWSIVMFDISQLKKFYREAFRGKLKELGFYPLQKSVWIHPFNCRREINLLKGFFNLSDKEIRLIISEDIGEDCQFKKYFNLA